MTELELAWFAGLYEGEGNIYRNDKRRSFQMTIKMKDQDIIERVFKIVECGRLLKRNSNPKKYDYYMYEWILCRTNQILDLCHKILPYMGERRKQQILKAITGKVLTRKERRYNLETVPECGYMTWGELSNRGAKRHVRRGEKPCPTCAHNQRIYLRDWRNKANP